jgi:hypothetical protein
LIFELLNALNYSFYFLITELSQPRGTSNHAAAAAAAADENKVQEFTGFLNTETFNRHIKELMAAYKDKFGKTKLGKFPVIAIVPSEIVCAAQMSTDRFVQNPTLFLFKKTGGEDEMLDSNPTSITLKPHSFRALQSSIQGFCKFIRAVEHERQEIEAQGEKEFSLEICNKLFALKPKDVILDDEAAVLGKGGKTVKGSLKMGVYYQRGGLGALVNFCFLQGGFKYLGKGQFKKLSGGAVTTLPEFRNITLTGGKFLEFGTACIPFIKQCQRTFLEFFAPLSQG